MQETFLLLPLVLLFLGCEQLENITEFDPSQRYPTEVGHEWEYNTIWNFQYYNQSGDVDSSSFMNLGNTIVRIVSDREILGNYNDLVLFESYETVASSPQNKQRIWYFDSDSGFYAVAYSNAGSSQPVLPKQNNVNPDFLKKLTSTNILFPGFPSLSISQSITTDSIQFYSPPRKVLAYPLKIGSNWIQLTSPFYQERFINKTEKVTTDIGDYLCYKIETILNFPKITLNDFVSPSVGLVKREVGSDSVAIISFFSPDSVIGYYKSTTTSKLVRFKK